MSLFEEARHYFAEQFRWHLHEETYQQLNKDTWICKVSTMWQSAERDPAATFYLLHTYDGRRQQQFTFLDEDTLPALLDWCLKMAAKKGANHE